ncbi:MAG TPA: DUF6055 domain-containing protein [Thermoleophilaceae bacterium]
MSYGIRRLAAGAISVLTLLVLAAPASAARPDTTGWDELDSPHFAVHYPPASALGDAQALSSNLETAYATEVGSWGFNPPIPDSDSRVDVYVADTGGHLGESVRDNPAADTSSGYIVIDPSAVTNAETAAHEFFHILQYAIYAHGAKFLKEGTAEWAGANVSGGTGWLFTYWGAPDQPLDCIPTSPCGTNDYSYSRWLFFDYLSEHYGPGIVKELFQKARALAAGDDPATDVRAVDQVLAAHGAGLAQAFNGFTAANTGASYTFPGLAGSGKFPHAAAGMYTGAVSGTLPAQTLSVDHLAANYVYFYSGDTRVSSAGCGAATLNVSVDLPPGSASAPSISDAFGVQQLSVSGSTASASVPWTNCVGSVAVLGVPNPGTTPADDAKQFTTHATMTVTPVKLRNAAPPRVRVSIPRLAHVARSRPFLRFNVRSTGRGMLQVLLKSRYVRGSYNLRSGLNRLRLHLPRSFKGGRHQIVFRVFSTTGQRGQVVKRHVRINLHGKAAHGSPAKPRRFAA